MEDELRPDTQPEAPDLPREGEPPGPAAVPAPPAPLAPAPVTGEPQKRKIDVGFFILGFFTPMVVNFITGTVAVLVGNAMVDSSAGPEVAIAIGSLPVLLLIVFIVLLIVGRTKGNERMRSYGLGGLIAYAVGALLALLLWGACFLTLGGVLGN